MWTKVFDTAKILNPFELDEYYKYTEWSVGKSLVVAEGNKTRDILIELTIDQPIIKYFDSIVITKNEVYML